MTSKILIASALFLALFALCECGGHGGGGENKHVVIKVPIHHKNVHTKKIVTTHVRISGTDDGEVVCVSGCDGGGGFGGAKISGSISIGEPSYSPGSSYGHGWH